MRCSVRRKGPRTPFLFEVISLATIYARLGGLWVAYSQWHTGRDFAGVYQRDAIDAVADGKGGRSIFAGEPERQGGMQNKTIVALMDV